MSQSFDIRVKDPRVWGTPGRTPLTIVSTDTHASLPADDYRDYLDPQYRQYMDQYLEDIELHNRVNDVVGYPFSAQVLEIIDKRRAIQTGGETGYFDPDRRLREAEAEGVVAEFLHPFGPIAVTPFFDFMNRRCSDELRAAGARAHNRFLVEFCSAAPGRLLGVPCIYPWPDWEAAVEDCRAAKEAGFKAVMPAQQAGIKDDLPAFYDSWWDPFWRACQELELVVHVHAGFGNAQGSLVERVNAFRDTAVEIAGSSNVNMQEFDVNLAQQESALGQAFDTFVERRPLWQLMWGGAFDRYPRLKVCFVEIHGDWVPPTLAYLDARHARASTHMKLTPSEYWLRHCAVGASLMRYGDVGARFDIGIDKLMFGTDYPHMEGTWPNTLDWLRTTLGDVPELEARKILGENAIEFYGLDRELLEKTARRVGPFPDDVLGGHHVVDPQILKHFIFRAGINKPPSYDEGRLALAVDEDEHGAVLARAGALRAT
ncbi:MAG: hypothetical protein QOD92_3255 [Acidimicrobiaceae bacterium]